MCVEKDIDILTVSQGDSSPDQGIIGTDAKGIPLLQLKLVANTKEDITVSQIVFTASGTGHDVVDLMRVQLYVDTNSNGSFDPSVDTQIGKDQTYDRDDGQANFNFLNNQRDSGGILNEVI